MQQQLLVLVLVLIAMATKIDAEAIPPEEEKCGLWLGPSPIKESEEHGFGHSIFTGKFIKNGTYVLGSGVLDESKNTKVFGDLFVPVYDWESIDMATYAIWDDDGEYYDDDYYKKQRETTEAARSRINATLSEIAGQEPPLYHQLWNGDIYREEVLESAESMRSFVPGLSVICPCTYKNFNLEQVKTMTYRDWRDIKGIGHDETPPSPQAGSFSYLSNAMFVAARDILPGEELVVECADNSDEFDPTKYPLSKFKPKEAGGYSICLDDKVEERLADHTANIAGGSYGGQRGLFAKRNLKEDEILTSTPMIPVHVEELTMDREKYAALYEHLKDHGNIVPPKKKQLILNYMYGHPESSLLWLANAPLLHSVNHAPHDQIKTVQPNAKIQWHHDEYTDAQLAGKPLSRRQQFHHAELLEMDSREVVLKHGMGLVMDLVALRDIGENEEILIDYGKTWDDAWKKHKVDWQGTIEATKAGHADGKVAWKQQRKLEREENERQQKLDTDNVGEHRHKQKHVQNSMTAIPLSSYVTASDYNDLHGTDDLRTITEQRRNPYPSNIETACHFEYDWLDDNINADETADDMTFMSWYKQKDHFGFCLLPCIITERRDYVPGEEGLDYKDDDDDDDYFVGSHRQAMNQKKLEGEENGGSATSKRYTAKILDNHESNTAISYDCHIYSRFQYFYMDIPREGITFVNKPHSTDQWIDQAFRQPIGLPDEMMPKIWRDLSRRKGTRGGDRKTAPVTPTKEVTPKEEEDEKEYQHSVKKWQEGESRREKLEEIYEKYDRDSSPHEDL